MQAVHKFNLRDDRGMSTVEYVILMAVIVVGAIGIWTELGGHIMAILTQANIEAGDLRKSEGL